MKTRVSIVRCKTYEPEQLEVSVARAFELLGGISRFVKKGERILVKPNMLSGKPPEHGVNTHVEVVRAVVKLIKKCNASPVIGDNPGGSVSVKEAYEGSGIRSIAKEEGIELAEPKGVRIVYGIPVSSYFFECDKIISLPKMKTHVLTGITGAIKNMFGAVAGLNKSQCHKEFPKPEGFCKVLVDIFEAVRPELVLMDGIIAMDGDGPASGRLRPIGLLIAGQDSVAVDSVFSRLIGIDPFDIFSTAQAYKRGLGEIRLENIEILGERLEENLIRGFELPRSKITMNLPGLVIKLLAAFVKFGPYINKRLCKKCRICAETCPVSAIRIDEKRSIIDHGRCIRCMCCHEVCPYKAVELRRNILARAFGL